MKLEFIFSEVYHNNLNRYSPNKENWQIVKQHAESFIEDYKISIDKILEIIPELTKIPYPKENHLIKVYLVGWKGPSFSNPLTLRVRKDKLLMLTTLTHEILHIVYHELYPEPSLHAEEFINNYVEKIFEKIGISAIEQINQMRQFSIDKFKVLVN